MAAARGNETNVRIQTWRNIDDAQADIRRKMTAKYNVEF
jgi:hypothetical protein